MMKLLTAAALLIAAGTSACTSTGLAYAQEAGAARSETSMIHPNSIQPETTLDIVATGTSNSVPDIAIVTVGVQANAKTATDAMAQQAKSMNAMFDALAAAGVDRKDMQTSGLSLYPEQDYVTINEEGGVVRQEARLRGYVAANSLTLRARDLSRLGSLLDTLVGVGGNTINGVSFGLDNPAPAQDDARRKAMKDAVARAELYASAAGLRVGRIVTISEQQTYDSPMPVAAMRAESTAASTPVAAGEVGYSSTVTVRFELVK